MSPWKVILATMVIFGCGVVTGGLLMRTALPSRPAARPPAVNIFANPLPGQFPGAQLLRRMQNQLDLTEAQSEQITNIIKQSQDRLRPVMDLLSPKLHEESKRVRQEIRKVLNPDQQEKYDELLRNGRRNKAQANQAGQTNQP